MGDRGAIIRLWGEPDARWAPVAALASGTAAQIVRTRYGSEVIVSAAIRAELRPAVQRHCLEQHSNGCYIAYCVAARAWLRDAARRQSISTASA